MEKVSLVLTYMRQLLNVHSIVRQHLDSLNTSDKLRKFFQELPIAAYKRDHHLGDWLVQVMVKQKMVN